MISKHVHIFGRVQGVGFRASLAHEGVRRGLVGWVRNRHDGSVEAVITGDVANVDALVAWAHRGPLAARVTRVVVRTETDTVATGFDGIEQRATG